MMLRGLWKLTWIEIKIFMREPLGALGTVVIPVVIFVGLGRLAGGSRMRTPSIADSGLLRVDLPVFASVLIGISAVLSLVTIISIYREGGILKRLRATPLRLQTRWCSTSAVETAPRYTSVRTASKSWKPTPTARSWWAIFNSTRWTNSRILRR